MEEEINTFSVERTAQKTINTREPEAEPTDRRVNWRGCDNQPMNRKNTNPHYYRLRDWDELSRNQTTPYYDVIVTFKADHSFNTVDLKADIKLSSQNMDRKERINLFTFRDTKNPEEVIRDEKPTAEQLIQSKINEFGEMARKSMDN